MVWTKIDLESNQELMVPCGSIIQTMINVLTHYAVNTRVLVRWGPAN